MDSLMKTCIFFVNNAYYGNAVSWNKERIRNKDRFCAYQLSPYDANSEFISFLTHQILSTLIYLNSLA